MTVAPTSRGAAILDRILFWRGRRAEIAAVDRKIDSVQQQIDAVQQAAALLASQLVDLRAAVSDETGRLRNEISGSMSSRLTDLHAAVDEGSKRLREELPASLSVALETMKNDVVVQLKAATAEQLSKLAASLGEIAATVAQNRLGVDKVSVELPNLVTHVGTSVHSRLNSFENDYLVDFRARLEALSGQVQRVVDAGSNDSGKLLLERLAGELPNQITHVDTSVHSRLNSFENDYLVDFRTRLEALSGQVQRVIADGGNDAEKQLLERLAAELPNQITHVDTSVHSRLNSFENDYLVDFRARLEALGGLVQRVIAGGGSGADKLLLERLAGELPNQIMHVDTSVHSRLNSFENDYLVDFRARLEALGGLVQRMIDGAGNDAEKLLLEKLAGELPNQIMHVDSSVHSRLNSFENDYLAEVRSRVEALSVQVQRAIDSGGNAADKLLLEKLAGELPNQITHVDTSVHSRLNSFENDYLVDVRARLEALSGQVQRAIARRPCRPMPMRKRARELPAMSRR